MVHLSRAKDLKCIILKGSTFTFENKITLDGLKELLQTLHGLANLEHLQIRYYDPDELDIFFENLPALLENNKSISKLNFENQIIDSKKFELLCNQLSKLDRKFELELRCGIILSDENKILLKQVLETNPLISPYSLQKDLIPILPFYFLAEASR